MKTPQKTIYLDYAAATPVRPAVLKAMEPYWSEVFANPQSIHTPGQEAVDAVKRARSQAAEVLSTQESELIFTSGATEANSLVLVGVVKGSTGNHEKVLVSEIAHASVTNAEKSYANDMDVVSIPVGADGRLQTEILKDRISPETALISVSHANSEIGTIQPVSDIATVVDKYRRQHNSQYPLLHVDASQSPLYASVRPEKLRADLLTLNSQKMYGPKGVGLLWVRSGTPLVSLHISDSRRQVGDYQRLRPGTPPTPLIVGMSEALSWAQSNYEENSSQVEELRDYLITSLQKELPSVRINGSQEYRIAHNVSITLPETDHDYLAARLDQAGIAAATTSACQARKEGGSDVLRAVNEESALRFSLGLETTRDELDYVVDTLRKLA